MTMMLYPMHKRFHTPLLGTSRSLGGRFFCFLLMLTILPLQTGCLDSVNQTLVEGSQARHLIPVPMRKQIFRNTPTAKSGYQKPFLQEKQTPEMGYLGYGVPESYIGTADDQNPYGDDSYGAGFEAGCDNFSAIVGEGTLRLIKPKFDVERLVNDQWYLRGYQDAATYCTFNLDWEIH